MTNCGHEQRDMRWTGSQMVCGQCEVSGRPESADDEAFEVVENHPVFAAFSPAARATIARNARNRYPVNEPTRPA